MSSSAPALRSYSTDHLEIPGFLDDAVTAYIDWQQSRMRKDNLKSEFRRAGALALADGLDLEQIYEEQDPDFFIRQGVKRGITHRFVHDIKVWVERYCTVEEL